MDAWDDGEGWVWNDTSHVAYVTIADVKDEKRALYRQLHKLGIKFQQGTVCAHFDGDWVICRRGTFEPLLAIIFCETE